jgi:rhamnosyl/mannosyltransferase
MRVGYVSQFYYPHIGGIEQSVQWLAEQVVEEGDQARIVAAADERRGRYTHNGVDIRKIFSLGTVSSVPLVPTLPIHLRWLADWSDVIHYHLPHPLATTAHLLAVPNETPTVATYHSDIIRQKHLLRAYTPVLNRYLDAVDRIVTTSPRLRDSSEHLGPYTHKCSVVPLGIDIEAIHDAGDQFDLPGANDRPVVLFTGRLNYYKGVEYLVKAIQDVEADLLVVGDGERRDRLVALADRLGVTDRVHFLGRLSDGKLRYCYESSDVFCLPSVAPTEAFGIVQVEAMAHGLPVVNTSLPTGVPWVSKDGETGMTVPPRDPDALASALSTFLSDSGKREKFSARAKNRAENQFDYREMSAQMRDIYQSVVEE